MNKRRRYLAKRRRRWFGGARALQSRVDYPICPTCGDYLLACTCYERWLFGGPVRGVDEVDRWPPRPAEPTSH